MGKAILLLCVCILVLAYEQYTIKKEIEKRCELTVSGGSYYLSCGIENNALKKLIPLIKQHE